MGSLDCLYLAMLAAFFTHELDAVKRHEWRVLPVTRFLRERVGEQVFIWAHVPLFTAVLWGSGTDPVNGTRIAVSAFAVVHAGLHVAYRRHPAYEFDNPSSWGLIALTALLGAAYLAGAWAA